MSNFTKIICNICLEGQTEASNPIMTTVCGHEFHSTCIVTWTNTKLKRDQSEPNPCPLCKTKLGSNPQLAPLHCMTCTSLMQYVMNSPANFHVKDFFIKQYRDYPRNITKHLGCWEIFLDPTDDLHDEFLKEFESELEDLIEIPPAL